MIEKHGQYITQPFSMVRLIDRHQAKMLRFLDIMKPDINACPFCNGEVEFHTIRRNLSGNGTHYIECDICNLAMTEDFILYPHVNDSSGDSDKNAKDRLITRWNSHSHQ